MLARAIRFLDRHAISSVEVAVAVALFVAGAAVSALVLGVLLVRLPADYLHGGDPFPELDATHPVLRVLLRIGKNLAGVMLVALGVILSLPGIPGQGLLTIFIGVTLVDFPGKRWLERRILGVPAILRNVNRLRHRWGRAPLAP